MTDNHFDPFQILMVPPESDAAQVRRAFRQLAKIHHPDLPGGSATFFRRICDAYHAILRSRSKTSEVDAPPGSPSKDFKPVRGSNIRLKLELRLEETALGSTRTIRYIRHEPCTLCRPQPHEQCPVCFGAGNVFRFVGNRLTTQSCPRCLPPDRPDNRCHECGGATLVERHAEVQIKVPFGLETGVVLRLPGQGHYPPAPAFLPGDLLLKVTVRSHPLFIPDGRHLHLYWNHDHWPSQRPVIVPTLYGPVQLHRLPGRGEVIRLPHRGLPGLDSPDRGDLFVHY